MSEHQKRMYYSYTHKVHINHEGCFMNNNCFPDHFMFGGAVCALQAEGGFQEGGKGLSNGDLRKKGLGSFNDYDINNEDIGNLDDYSFRRGVNFFGRYKEYLAEMHELGLQCFRTSISWSRIFPNGDDEVPNEEGLKYYDDLDDKFKKMIPLKKVYIPVPKEL